MGLILVYKIALTPIRCGFDSRQVHQFTQIIDIPPLSLYNSHTQFPYLERERVEKKLLRKQGLFCSGNMCLRLRFPTDTSFEITLAKAQKADIAVSW